MTHAPSGSTPAAKPPASRDDAVAVVRRLRESGHVAYFAGGCVRDLLLGREPKDYDVATNAPPQRVRELFHNTQAVGAAFGVILVRHRRSVVEVATFRADGEYQDGRHPAAVRFTTAEEDAQRRDFSINGLFLDPLEGDRVLDFVGGREDIAARWIRAIGDPERRFDEDHLRLLRAVRFAARLDFNIEPGTASAIKRHAPQLKRISPERIADELRVMLTPPTRASAWRLLRELGLTREIFRFLPDVPDDLPPQSPPFDHFAKVCPPEPLSFGLALAAAVTSLGLECHGKVDHYASPSRLKKVVQALRQSLKISNDETADLSDTLEGFALVLADGVKTLAQKQRFLARPFSRHSRLLLLAQAAIPGEQLNSMLALEGEFRALETLDFAPLPLLTGDDLTAAGLTPGPAFKRILDAVYDAQLEGRVRSKADALESGLKLAAQG